MKYIALIRHAPTAGNEIGAYIGRTDQPLSAAGEAQARAFLPPPADKVACSPLLRCRRTAQLLYPQAEAEVWEGFAECDFGKFEGKTAAQLEGDADYLSWLESGGRSPFPEGEAPEAFVRRTVAAFEAYANALPDGCRAALVVHGGSIMAVLSALALPRRSFYEWHVPNLGGYVLALGDGAPEVAKKL